MNVEELVEHSTGLFSLPDVCERVNELLDDPEATDQEIAEVIELDAALTAVLLKKANQTSFSGGRQIDNVGDAAAKIGLDNLRVLATTMSVAEAFTQVDSELVDMANFWHHSVCCGIAAKSLAGQCNVEDTQQLFVAGLLHDIGQLVLYRGCPDVAEQVLRKAGESEYYRYRAEKEIMGFTHAKVGAELLRRWQLPRFLQQLVEFHHEPMNAADFPREASIIHIATAVANRVEPSWKMTSVQQSSPLQIDPEAWEAVGLNPEVIESTLEDVNLKSFEVLSVVNPGSLFIY